MHNVREFFEHPGAIYNFWSLALSSLGVALGIFALIFAYVQIAKTLTAANAARDAALNTAKKIGHLNALMSVQKLTALVGETVSLMRSENYNDAAIRSQDLRNGIAEFRHSVGAKELGTAGRWNAMIIELAEVEKGLRTLNPNIANEKVIMQCMDCLVNLQEDLHTMAGVAARINGE